MYNEAPWVSQQQKFRGIAWISLSQLTMEGQAQQDCCSQSGASHMSMWTASRAGLSRVREGWAVWSLRHCVQISLVEPGLRRDGNLESHTTGNQATAEIIPNLHLLGKRLKTRAWTMSEERGTVEGETRASPKQDGRDTWVWAPGSGSKVLCPSVQHQFCSLPRGSSQVFLHTSCCWQTLGSGSSGRKWEKELWSWAPSSVDWFPSMLIRTRVFIILFNSCTHIPGSSGSWWM